jgi:hypothetical protein
MSNADTFRGTKPPAITQTSSLPVNCGQRLDGGAVPPQRCSGTVAKTLMVKTLMVKTLMVKLTRDETPMTSARGLRAHVAAEQCCGTPAMSALRVAKAQARSLRSRSMPLDSPARRCWERDDAA